MLSHNAQSASGIYRVMHLPSAAEFRKLINSGHGRASVLVRQGHGQRYRRQIIEACRFDRRVCDMTCEDMGPYLARILVDAKIDIVEMLAARANSRAHRRDRELAVSILRSLGRRGDARAVAEARKHHYVRREDEPSKYDDLRWASFPEFLSFALEDDPPRYIYSRFARGATADELLQAANAISRSFPDNVVYGLIWMFTSRGRTFPLQPRILIAQAKSKSEKVRHAAFYALSRLEHPEVRLFAEKCLREEYEVAQALSLFRKNWKRGDLERLWRLVVSKGFSDDEVHGTLLDFLEIIESSKEKIRADILKWIYEVSSCSKCRSSAVWRLAKLKALPAEWAPELRRDSERFSRDEAKNATA